MLLSSLLLSLAVSLPRNVRMTNPNWYLKSYRTRGLYGPLETDAKLELVRIEQGIDEAYTEIYRQVLESNRRRGQFLFAAVWLLFGGILLAVYTALRVAHLF